jgi:hypothetical protein
MVLPRLGHDKFLPEISDSLNILPTKWQCRRKTQRKEAIYLSVSSDCPHPLCKLQAPYHFTKDVSGSVLIFTKIQIGEGIINVIFALKLSSWAIYLLRTTSIAQWHELLLLEMFKVQMFAARIVTPQSVHKHTLPVNYLRSPQTRRLPLYGLCNVIPATEYSYAGLSILALS